MKLTLSQNWLDIVSREAQKDLPVGRPVTFAETDLDAADLFRKLSNTPMCKEMIRRGWIETRKLVGEKRIREIGAGFERLFAPSQFAPALFKGTSKLSIQSASCQVAVLAWLIQVQRIAAEVEVVAFEKQSLSASNIQDLVQLSRLTDGPIRARDWLRSVGIPLVFLSSLPGMKLDGATSSQPDGNPFIALTVRYDRVDSFWFTLLHEIGHIVLHSSRDSEQVFLDDLDEADHHDEIEAEANAFARDSFVARDVWRRSDAFRRRNRSSVEALAKKLNISPAIVAGRIRHETKDYSYLSDMVGQGSVRTLLFD